jgi:hypothetical protein
MNNLEEQKKMKNLLDQNKFKTLSAEKSLGSKIGGFAGEKLGKYALSQYCKSIGLEKTPKYELQLNEIIESVNELNKKVNQVIETLDDIQEFEKMIYTQMEKNNYKNNQKFLNTILTLEGVYWDQFVNATGEKTLEELAKDTNSLKSLATLLTNDYLSRLTIQSNMLSNTTDGSPVIEFLSSKKDYVDSLIPKQGKENKDDLISILNLSNETLMNFYYQSLNALQCIYIIQKTALYLKYNSKNNTLQKITLAESNIKNESDFETNDNNLYEDYEKKFNNLETLINASVVSDICDQDFKVGQRAIDYKGVPKGDWVKDCILYAWCGVANENNTYVGFYNGIKLTAKGTHNERSNISTLDLNKANEPSLDKPVLTYTRSPYLECEFLKQNSMTFVAKRDVKNSGGYCDSYSGSRMNSIDVSDGIIIYGSQTVVKSNKSLLTPTSRQASIDQFLQVNFSNKERALFQITRGAYELILVLMGKGGNYEWTYSNNTGKEPDAVSGGWKGGGYSEITLTSKSKEESVKIKVDGEKYKVGKNYYQPTLSLIKL